MTDIALAAERVAATIRAEWRDLTYCVFNMRESDVSIDQVAKLIAEHTGAPLDNLKRKMRAIEALLAEGKTREEIINLGQHRTLSKFYKARSEKEHDSRVMMRFQVMGSQRDGCYDEIDRIRKVLKIGTVEGFWDWQVAQWRQMTEEDLKHSAGLQIADQWDAALDAMREYFDSDEFYDILPGNGEDDFILGKVLAQIKKLKHARDYVNRG